MVWSLTLQYAGRRLWVYKEQERRSSSVDSRVERNIYFEYAAFPSFDISLPQGFTTYVPRRREIRAGSSSVDTGSKNASRLYLPQGFVAGYHVLRSLQQVKFTIRK